jgi:hypothetical protein
MISFISFMSMIDRGEIVGSGDAVRAIEYFTRDWSIKLGISGQIA